MDSGNLTLTAWGYGLTGLGYSFFALQLSQLGYLREPRELSRTSLLAAIATTALWGWFGVAFMLTGVPVLLVLSTLLDSVRYGCWFTFLGALVRGDRKSRMPAKGDLLGSIAIAMVAASILTVFLAFSGLAMPGYPARVMLFNAMVLPVFAMVLLEQVYRNASEDTRWSIKPLSLGLAGAFLFDLYLYSQAFLFTRPDADALSIRGIVHTLMIPLLLLSSTRRSDWLSKIRISPKAAFHSASLLIAGVYLVFLSVVGYYVRYFGGEWGRALQMGLVFMGLVFLAILVLSASIRAKLRVLLGKHFFRYRYDYREEWLKFTQTLSAKNSPQEMGQQVIRGLADMLESPAGGLWLKTMGESAYRQISRWNMEQTLEIENADSPICRFMTDSGWVVNLEEYRSFSRRYGQLKLPDWLQKLPQAWLVVPLKVGENLIGFVVLASARTRVEVNWEINDLLKTAGQQAASFLAQMQATEALLEARKFDAFNRMSAFVVHDLKNIVAQLSLMLKNAKRLADNPEFQQDMLMTVENSLDRMRQLMLQLREGATPPGKAFGVSLENVIRRVEAAAATRGRVLEIHLRESLSTRGHEERLERILGHVVQNAFDATEADGRVWMTLDRVGGQAEIVVGDTGHGMSQDFIRERLFKPFQTTKQAGMGIGAYESFQYVQELGGRISVESEVNKGTLVTILLPLFDSQKNSDLVPLENL